MPAKTDKRHNEAHEVAGKPLLIPKPVALEKLGANVANLELLATPGNAVYKCAVSNRLQAVSLSANCHLHLLILSCTGQRCALNLKLKNKSLPTEMHLARCHKPSIMRVASSVSSQACVRPKAGSSVMSVGKVSGFGVDVILWFVDVLIYISSTHYFISFCTVGRTSGKITLMQSKQTLLPAGPQRCHPGHD